MRWLSGLNQILISESRSGWPMATAPWAWLFIVNRVSAPAAPAAPAAMARARVSGRARLSRVRRIQRLLVGEGRGTMGFAGCDLRRERATGGRNSGRV